MSQLIDRVNADLKASMKARDKQKTGALRMIRAAIIEAQKAGTGEVTDDQVVALLRRIRKQRVDAAQQYTAAGREDLAENEMADVPVIDAYLPQLADEAQTLIWVREILASSGITDPRQAGRAMGALMRAHRGEVDGGLARRLIQQELGG